MRKWKGGWEKRKVRGGRIEREEDREAIERRRKGKRLGEKGRERERKVRES